MAKTITREEIKSKDLRREYKRFIGEKKLDYYLSKFERMEEKNNRFDFFDFLVLLPQDVPARSAFFSVKFRRIFRTDALFSQCASYCKRNGYDYRAYPQFILRHFRQ